MGKISISVIFVFIFVIASGSIAWTEEKEATRRTVWEFKSSKVVIQVFVKKKPWSSEDAEVLSNLLGFDVTTKTWYYAVIKNLQKDIEIYYEPSDFIVILKDRKQAEGRRLSFNSAPFVEYEEKVQADDVRYERLIELENMIDLQTILPEAEHAGVFIFEKDVKENDIYKLYFHYTQKNYLLEKKIMEIKEPEL